MTRYLVTGASGLLGLNFALEALKAGHSVSGVVNRQALIEAPFEVVQLDLCQPGNPLRALEATRPDVLVHCAAMAVVDDCEKFPDMAGRVNADLPAELAALCSKNDIKMVQISTDAVFDGQSGLYTEDDLTNPLSMYARTKLDAEKRVMQINPDALVARINIFGWSLNGSRSLAEMFYNNLSNEKPVKGFTDVIFCPLLVNDLSHILMESVALGLKGLYHMVSCDSLSKYEFGVRIAKIFGFDAKLISPVSWKEGGLLGNRSPDLRVSAAKLAKHLGKATPSVDDGLTRFHGLFQTGYAQHLQSMRFGRGSGQ